MVLAKENTMENKKILSLAVIVSALGYFVDIYDLVLFGIVRVPSLKALGVADADLLTVGTRLLDAQMYGMLAGGILWGILGDKRGRVSVLFGSILLYSLANIGNAFVTGPDSYTVLRFLAGVGLAGELGAAITLVSETSHKDVRGYSTSIVAGVGVSGAVFAGVVGQALSWSAAYIVGGVLGLALLALRFKLLDSGMYQNLRAHTVSRGAFHQLFTDRQRLIKYLGCVLIGVPIWFVIGILIFFSPKITKALGVTEPVIAAQAVMAAYAGLVVGDFGTGLLSQWLRSRRKVLYGFVTATGALIFLYTHSPAGMSSGYFYTLCFLLGVAFGYWAIFVTVASDQFGTNIRATVTTTVPNFVRGSVPLNTAAMRFLIPDLGIAKAAVTVGLANVAIALIAVSVIPETFGKDLDYHEQL
jgi:MFS family permease